MVHRYLGSPIRILLAAALVFGMLPGRAFGVSVVQAAPLPGTTEGGQSVTVSVSTGPPAVAADGEMTVAVAVTTSAPAEYIEVRLRMRSPSGRLVYQKTEIRANSPAGTQVIDFKRDLGTLGAEQGRYPLDVRVLATDAEPTTATSRLLVLDPDAEPIPVAVVISALDVPAVTMDGRLSQEPGTSRLRGDLALVTQLAADHGLPISLAIPPVLIEQFARVAEGYETTSGASVDASAEAPQRFAHLLEDLQSVIDTGTLSLIDVPYALPDASGLAAMGAETDLELHWASTDMVNASVLRSAPGPGATYLGSSLTREGIASAAARGATCVLAGPAAVLSEDATAAPGCYAVAGTDARILVVDENAASGLRLGQDAFYDALFDRFGTGPVVIMVPVGAGSTGGTVDLQHALDWIDAAPWLNIAPLDSLSESEDLRTAELAPLPASTAPEGYWAAIAEGRRAAIAYSGALGTADADAAAALRAALVAESSLFSEPDATWSNAPGSLALAREALDFVSNEFALVHLDAKDVTLSGSTGDVPLTLINDTGKQIQLTLHATSSTMSEIPVQELSVQPTQSFHTVPVDLGNALSDELSISVRAGDVTVSEAVVTVRASYIDRLGTVAMVVIVLAGLLIFIRRRVRLSDAGTIVES